jgi:hypothetical protein
MHNLPLSVLRSKDHRNPQSGWGEVFHSAKLDLYPLQPYSVGKLGSHILHYGLEAQVLAISEIRGGTLYGLSNLLPPTRGRAKGVSEGYVISMGEQILHRFRVSFHELIQRQMILLNKLVYIVYGRHLLEITSIVGTSFFSS